MRNREFAPPLPGSAPGDAPHCLVELPAEELAAPVARHLAVERCLAWGLPTLTEGVSHLVTELVTNAVVHTHKPLELSLTLLPDRIRVAVSDHDPNQPARTRAPVDALRGRGLRVIEAMADAWGIEPKPGGKIVWAELRLPNG